MFDFIKRLFGRKSNQSPAENQQPEEKTIQMNVGARAMTDELTLASFVSILSTFLAKEYFAKKYQCVVKFLNQDNLPIVENPLTFEMLKAFDSEASNLRYYNTGILKFAKRYTMLSCKCVGCPEFDNWMKQLSKVVVAG